MCAADKGAKGAVRSVECVSEEVGGQFEGGCVSLRHFWWDG